MAQVEMYSIKECSYCVDAKAILKQKDVDFIDRDISDLPDAELNAKMMELTGRKTVPQIWINGEHAGEFHAKLGLANAGHHSGQ